MSKNSPEYSTHLLRHVRQIIGQNIHHYRSRLRIACSLHIEARELLPHSVSYGSARPAPMGGRFRSPPSVRSPALRGLSHVVASKNTTGLASRLCAFSFKCSGGSVAYHHWRDGKISVFLHVYSAIACLAWP